MTKFFKLILGILLLPACIEVTLIFKQEVLGLLKTEWYFFAGLFSYLVLLAIFQQPIQPRRRLNSRR